MEVPATAAGKVVAVQVKVGDKVNEGDVIVVVESAAVVTAAAAPIPVAAAPVVAAVATSASKAETVPMPKAPVPAPTAINEGGFARAHAGPSVRKLARELGVDLSKVKGSGRKGRIMEPDVKAFVKGVMSGALQAANVAAPAAANGGGLDLLPWPKVDFAKFGPCPK